jgi:hypothetical protein
MTKDEYVVRLYKIRDALDFQMRFSEMTKTPIVTIDKEDAYLFQALIEGQIEKMKGGAE